MNEATLKKAHKTANRAKNIQDNTPVALAKEFINVEDKIDTVAQAVSDIADKLDQPEVEKPEVQKVELMGVSVVTLKGAPGDKPTEEELLALIEPLIPVVEDGKDYVLTEQDKKDIAKSIKVPVVEKIIEKTETIVEQPIVTNEIKEVAVTESAENIVSKINSLETTDEEFKIDASHIKNLPKPQQVIGGGGNRYLENLVDVNLTGVIKDSEGKYQLGSGSSAGEVNTASNVGTAGVGIFKQKTGVNLEFKKINAGSSKVTVTDDTVNHEVDIDVSVTKSDVGLANVDNTSDLNKPVSTATQTALNAKQPLDAGLTSISSLTGSGYVKATATDTFTQVSTIPNTDITGLGTLATQNGTFSGTSSGTNTGDQTSIVGITGTKAQFNTAVTDGDIMYVGDAPTAHTHTSADITDFNSATRAQVEAELVAGTNVTITPSGTGTTRQLTISATGGGGGGGGITRSISSISTNTTAGATTLTDYVYFITGTTTLTLPTAVGNTNRYTIKSISGTTTVATTASQTIDGTTTIGIQNQDSVDIVSDNTNWNVI